MNTQRKNPEVLRITNTWSRLKQKTRKRVKAPAEKFIFSPEMFPRISWYGYFIWETHHKNTFIEKKDLTQIFHILFHKYFEHTTSLPRFASTEKQEQVIIYWILSYQDINLFCEKSPWHNTTLRCFLVAWGWLWLMTQHFPKMLSLHRGNIGHLILYQRVPNHINLYEHHKIK